jgi:hypothetical protein
MKMIVLAVLAFLSYDDQMKLASIWWWPAGLPAGSKSLLRRAARPGDGPLPAAALLPADLSGSAATAEDAAVSSRLSRQRQSRRRLR